MVINLKKKSIRIFRTLFLSLLFGVIFFVSGFLYLNSQLEKITVSEKAEKVPYYSVPNDATLLFNICEDSVLVNLKFKEEKVNVAFLENSSEYYGYTIDYTVNCDYDFVGYLVDIVGGIEIDGYRQTGIQVIELLEFTQAKNSQKQSIAKSVVKGIASSGFTKENLLYIIENSDSNLKFNDCYFWTEHISKLCKFPCYIN